jgi:hypothetical protein
MPWDNPSMNWTDTLLEQLTFHWEWEHGVRAHLDGMTDDEHVWEPVDGCWSIRPRAEARTGIAGGAGDLVAEFAFPEPDPTPFTTIAWRLAHVSVGCFGMRNAAHFGGPPIDYFTAEWPATAEQALAMLDEHYERWVAGVRALGEEGLGRPVGDAEPFPDAPYAALVLHINREAIHHLAEVSLLRDLYRSRR